MDEDHVLSTDVRLALLFYVPTSKNLKRQFERAYCVCFVRYFIRFFFFFFFFFFVLFCFFSQWLEPLFGVKIFRILYKHVHIRVLSFIPYKTN